MLVAMAVGGNRHREAEECEQRELHLGVGTTVESKDEGSFTQKIDAKLKTMTVDQYQSFLPSFAHTPTLPT